MRTLSNLFLKADVDQDRLPVIILSGFLGSGKTTFVNAMLRDPAMARTAVAVNEFGAIPLDADLIDHGADKTVVMANGCLCCNLAGDMDDAIMRLFTRRDDGTLPTFERLVIEPSGLADPAPIAQAILRNPMMARALRFEGIVTMVDALFAEAQLGCFPETRKQVALADKILISKSDLAERSATERVEALVRHLNPAAPIMRAGQPTMAATSIFPASFLDGAAPHTALTSAYSHLFAEDVTEDAAHAQAFIAVALRCSRPLDWRAFDGWLRSIRLAHAEDLLRIKGLVQIDGTTGPVVVHGVHHVLHPPISLERWPDAEPNTRLILIVAASIAADVRTSWDLALPGLIAVS